MFEEKQSTRIRAVPITQPIGTFYVGVIKAQDLVEISYTDIRSMERDLDTYIGIQRRLSRKRVEDIKKYVETSDATFPTSVIIAVDEDVAIWHSESQELEFRANDDTPFHKIAKIIDGQHRVDGLKEIGDRDFELTVSVFVGAALSTQANIFATVNLAQTKVNKSLVYDLFDYEKEPTKILS